MAIVAAGIAPHPPIIIPDIGRGELKKVGNTVEALRRLSLEIAGASPETVIIITPHGPIHRHTPIIISSEELSGDFSRFFAPGVKMKAQNDRELVEAIKKESAEDGKEVILRREGGERLDHGATVPLYYLQEAGTGKRLIPISFSLQSYKELFQFGKSIKRAVDSLGRRTAIIASGDLSHRLTRDAPAGYNPRGQEFDEKLVACIRDYRVNDIMSMDDELVSDAGECGLRSIIILLGALDNTGADVDVLSYEGPFGVGYMVAKFSPS